MIEPASAVDAQGRNIPVSYEQTSIDTVAMHLAVPADAAYPIAVDPIVSQNYPLGTQLQEAGACWGDWQFYSSAPYLPLVFPVGGSPEALSIEAQAGASYPGASFGECVRTPPANSYVYEAEEFNTSLVQGVYPVELSEGLFSPAGNYLQGTYTDFTVSPPYQSNGTGMAERTFYSPVSGQVNLFWAVYRSPTQTSTSVPDGTAATCALSSAYTFPVPAGASSPYAAMGTSTVLLSDDHPPVLKPDSPSAHTANIAASTKGFSDTVSITAAASASG